ncbi:unnamed protein product [Brachionus calyciflorus]|uniref:Uncharacterized protein n=1 Tax=Brachionus calyciflorus TaxID=104777 RepID=A0A813PPE0_9BILA|nr:unnamed protein product [Brachionus calyciflorus]
MNNLHRTCAHCPARLDSNSKLKNNKIGISSSCLKMALSSLGIEYLKYKYVCNGCHKKLSKLCPNKGKFYNQLRLEELIQTYDPDTQQDLNSDFETTGENDPKVTTEAVCLDYASIDDKRYITGKVSLINALGFYLTKLRTGVSLQELSAFVPIASYDQIKRSVRQVRQIISELFTPLYLGFNSFKREGVIENHTTTMSKVLLNANKNDVITIWVAAYLYIDKSSSYTFQKVVF